MQLSRSFFDPALSENGGAAFIREDKVDEALARLIPRIHITKGRYSCRTRSAQRDLVWNHMDQNHRPLVHRTYRDAIRLFIGERAAYSLTRIGPFVIPVFDGYYKDNGFYQVVCLFGLIVIVNTIECTIDGQGTRMDIDWAIASHRLLRMVHPMLDRRLQRLNVVQNAEDDEIRDRRIALRGMGYRFGTDTPDFLSANVIANNVVFPRLNASHSIALGDLPESELRRIEIANRAYVLRRTGESVEVWPGICQHEGAALGPGNLHDGTIKCPWHGLEFTVRRLRPAGPEIILCGARLKLDSGRITLEPLETGTA